MTDDAKSAPAPDTATPADPDPNAPGSTTNKAFWLGMGVGSAALVAALMYGRRPKRRK